MLVSPSLSSCVCVCVMRAPGEFNVNNWAWRTQLINNGAESLSNSAAAAALVQHIPARRTSRTRRIKLLTMRQHVRGLWKWTNVTNTKRQAGWHRSRHPSPGPGTGCRCCLCNNNIAALSIIVASCQRATRCNVAAAASVAAGEGECGAVYGPQGSVTPLTFYLTKIAFNLLLTWQHLHVAGSEYNSCPVGCGAGAMFSLLILQSIFAARQVPLGLIFPFQNQSASRLLLLLYCCYCLGQGPDAVARARAKLGNHSCAVRSA